MSIEPFHINITRSSEDFWLWLIWHNDDSTREDEGGLNATYSGHEVTLKDALKQVQHTLKLMEKRNKERENEI